MSKQDEIDNLDNLIVQAATASLYELVEELVYIKATVAAELAQRGESNV